MAYLDRVFLWETAEGDIVELSDMDTKHLFNSMKMVFNHLAATYGGEPVMFTVEYDSYYERAVEDPGEMAHQVLVFMAEIERRGNLELKYRQAFNQIKRQVVPNGARLLSTGKS